MMIDRNFKRIICLTEETTETIYDLGKEDLLVGITQFTMRPERAKKEKPIVSRYIDAKIDKILELKPDLVIAWSDLQAEICANLIKSGVNVLCFNHQSLEGVFDFIFRLSLLLDAKEEGEKYILDLRSKLDLAKGKGLQRKVRPKVYFEEWDEPLITGITWVSELIEICGGVDIFSETSRKFHAKDRILESDSEILKFNPDIMLASWCGKKFKRQQVEERKGWSDLNCVKDSEIYELPAEVILQPGPALLKDGLDMVMEIFDNWEKRQINNT